MTPPPAALKKALTPLHLWGIAVGLVISGGHFGWNYGWAAGPGWCQSIYPASLPPVLIPCAVELLRQTDAR